MTTITVTTPGLVLLVGAMGSGKTTLAHRLFEKHEIVSLDDCRELVSGDRTDQSATRDAMAVAEAIIERRLKRRLLTVVDATNVRSEDRRTWTAIAARTHSLVTAIVLDPGESFCHANAKARDGDRYNGKAVSDQTRLLGRDRRKLTKFDGIRNVMTLDSPAAIDDAVLARRPTWNDRRAISGPFDIVGDIHGATDEAEALLAKLGWSVVWSGEGEERMVLLSHPEDRKLIFLGDAVDRGPRSLDALLLMEEAVTSGQGYAIASNHDERFKRWLMGRHVSLTNGIDTTIAEFADKTPSYKARIAKFIDGLHAHLVFDGGKLVVAHAGIEEGMILGASPEVREFAIFGPRTTPDAEGHTQRIDWAADYRGKANIVYGHTVVDEPTWFNSTICIDTGCVFGGSLTALRWPERELVSVPANKAYAELDKPAFSRKVNRDPLLIDMADVSGKKYVTTALMGRITVEADHMSGALEQMARHAIDPRWMIYIPPTMSPVESSKEGSFLEHPAQAFAYYQKNGVSKLVVETKHMGSRALIAVCRSMEAAEARFGIDDGHLGHVWSRSGRAFFSDEQRREVLGRLSLAAAPLFTELATDWLLLDAEIMPWNSKAAELIEQNFAPTGIAAGIGSGLALEALERFRSRGLEDVSEMVDHFATRAGNAARFDANWRGYCWDAPTLSEIRIAPFHVLASEGRVHKDETHMQHLEWIAMLSGDPMIEQTSHLFVDLDDAESVAAAVAKWQEDTSAGAEGVVVKPHTFNTKVPRGLVQPAIKVRGPDYLRIIYGVDYDLPENLERLRERGLNTKRNRALKQFSLGIEGLERFVRREPIRTVHECVYSTIALDSEPLDPRL